MKPTYVPIACGLHDELQLRVMRGRRVELAWRDDEGTLVRTSGRLVDVSSRDGAEYLRLDDDTDIRLDRLVEVDGLAFGHETCSDESPSR